MSTFGMEDWQALIADERVLVTRDILRYNDMDDNGHLNNSVFTVLCESGRVHYFRARVTPHLPDHTFFVIARIAIDFKAEAFYPGEALTATWLEHLGRSSLRVRQKIISADKLVAEAEGVCVVMDQATRRPFPIPDATRAALEPLLHAP
ncbi:MAG: acyl-CoA thioesterase [Salinarimonas sp.]